MDTGEEYKESKNLPKENAEDEEEEEKEGKVLEGEAKEEENYEFLIPISNDNKLKTFVDRYFLKYYSIFSKEDRFFQYAYVHTNKLIMIGITSQHRICAEPDPIKSISFDCVYKGNNINAIVKGKKKRGGIKVKPDTHVCEVLLESGLKIPVRGVIDGYIIEFNDSLIKKPSLLKESPESKGYVAILNVGLKGVPKKVEHLLSQENYLKEIGN